MKVLAIGLIGACLARAAPAPEQALGGKGYVRYQDMNRCPPLPSKSAPESADDVRPDQIEVIMAMGDSLTAALVARDSPEELPWLTDTDQVPMQTTTVGPADWLEYRGLSYPIGVDDEAISIASILEHYTPLEGVSRGHGKPIKCAARVCGRDERAGLNAAISGSVATSLQSQVTDWLVPRLKELNVSDQAWKLVNVGVGGNDLCSSCLEPDVELPFSHRPQQYARDIKTAINHLRMHAPRLIVNIVGLLRITPLYDLKLRSPKCASLPLLPSPSSASIPGVPNFPLECSCALLPGPAGNITRARMDALADAYDTAMLDVIREWEEEAALDPYFGVVWQPGSAIDLGSWPEEALSGADCFHPSLEAHKRVGAGFWNRLTLDLKRKAEPIVWEDDIWVRCLKEEDRFPVGKVTKQRHTIGK